MHPLVQQAADFAEVAHRSIDQRRKYSDEPYIVHPKHVAEIVASVTDDPVVLAAAWLHDVVEDTPIQLETITLKFGTDVAGLVDDLTDVSRRCDGNRAARRAIDRKHTARADPRAKTVKLADIISNLSDLVDQNPGFARVYLGEKVLLMEVLKEGDATLYARAQDLIERSLQQLDERREAKSG
ncbi:MAG: HD domain-containing protein [Planctomycetota bacterium]